MNRKITGCTLSVLFLLILIFAWVPAVVANIEDDSLTVVQDGQAQAVVVVEDEMNADLQHSVNILVEYVQKSTGVELPVMIADELAAGASVYETEIYLAAGENSLPGDVHVVEGLQGLDRDGFLLHPHDNRLSIVGPTELGTRNGVYEFLERYVGVRWLFPGEDWEHVPQKDVLLVPREDIREEPDTRYRVMNLGGDGTEHSQIRREWSLKNRIQSPHQLQLGHNLYSLFPPDKYGELNPEFYPGGQPPAPGETTRWQPCFSEAGTVDAAVDEILAYFAARPDVDNISLGVNDIGGYCETDPSHPAYPGKTNSIGLVDMSDIYYGWVNQVVERVLKIYPDKWFGLYAYQEVMDPPSFPLNPRVIPVVTKDRLTWIDEDIRNGGQQHLADWNEAASQTGWYEYLYGYSYFLPRTYTHHMADNYKYAKDQNIVVHRSDFHPVLGDGPKGWISTKLQWDADQDVDELLQDWYEAAVGLEAAPDLAAYYEIWETFWTERILQSNWFHRSKNNTYLTFNDASYLSLVTEEDMLESRRLLESVIDKAETAEQQKRAEQILLQFEFYEASALSYPRSIDLPDSEEGVLQALDSIGTRVQFAQKKHDLIEQFKGNPALQYPANPFGRVNWTGWNGNEFLHFAQYLAQHEPNGGPVTERVKQMAYRDESKALREFASLLLHADLDDALIANPSFENGNEDAPPWIFWNPMGTAHIQRIEGMAATGNSSLRFEQSEQAGVYQTHPIRPGLLAAQISFFTPEGNESSGSIQLVVEVFNEDGQKVIYRSDSKTFSSTAGEWATVSFLEEVPELIQGKEVDYMLINAQIHNAQDTVVYVDDFAVYQYESSINDMIAAIEQWKKTGEIENEAAARALSVHLTAIGHFQQNGEIEKVIRHLQGFHQLVDHQYNQELLSTGAYQLLTSYNETLQNQLYGVNLHTTLINAKRPGDYPVSLTLTNHATEPFEGKLLVDELEEIELQLDPNVYVNPGDALDVEGILHIPSAASEGDYDVTIQVLIGDTLVDTLSLSVSYSKNLLENPGFEQPVNGTLPGWNMRGARLVEDVVYKGQFAATLVADSANEWNVFNSQTVIKPIPGVPYKLSGWVKNDSTTGDTYIGIRSVAANGETRRYDWEKVYTDSDWTYYEIQVLPPSDTASIQVFLRVDPNANGQAWFDEFRLEIAEDRNLLRNPGFEDIEEDAEGNPIPVAWSIRSGQLVQDEIHSGNYAVTLISDPENTWNVINSRDNLPVLPDTSYRLSGWMKFGQPGGQVDVLLRELDANYEKIQYVYNRVRGGSEWQYFETVIRPTENTKYMNVFFLIGTRENEQVWFDDFELEVYIDDSVTY